MNDLFYTLWEGVNTKVVYISPRDLGHLEHHIREYSKKKAVEETCYVLYYHTRVYTNEEWAAQNIHVLRSPSDFEPYFLLHMLRHDSFSSHQDKIPDIIALYDRIHIPFSEFETKPSTEDRRNYVEGQIRSVYKSNLSRTTTIRTRLTKLRIDVDIHDTLQTQLIEYVHTIIPTFSEWIDLAAFAAMYWFPYSSHILPCIRTKTIVLENVYYKNKQWYDSDRNPLVIEDFDKDFEYRSFPKQKHTGIGEEDAEDISVEVMFLDYIYDFYNFGEFWDVVKRLLYANQKGLPLFHLPVHRVSSIDYYFRNLGYTYPSQYVYKRNKLFHFQKVHVSIVQGGTRGVVDRFFTYRLNRLMNPEIREPLPFSYKLYLTRGSYKRGIIDEDTLIKDLQSKQNFVILNGSESLSEIMYYFTHASLIIGAHSSLMKNMIWSMKNPILIDIMPLSRSHTPDMCGNASSLGFQTFYFVCECDENEQIRFRADQRNALIELVNTLSYLN